MEKLNKYYSVLEQNGMKENLEYVKDNGEFKLREIDASVFQDGRYYYAEGVIVDECIFMYVDTTEFVGFTGINASPYSPVRYLEAINVCGKKIVMPIKNQIEPEELKTYYKILCMYSFACCSGKFDSDETIIFALKKIYKSMMENFDLDIVTVSEYSKNKIISKK